MTFVHKVLQTNVICLIVYSGIFLIASFQKANEETKISRREGNRLYDLITDYRLGKKGRSEPLSEFSQRIDVGSRTPEGPMLKPMLYLALAVIWETCRMRWQNLMTLS